MECPICGCLVVIDDELEIEHIQLELERLCILYDRERLSLPHGKEVNTKKFIADYFRKENHG